MKIPPRVNVAKFYSRLNVFHVDRKFTDVTIQCADRGDSFQCHRLVLALASDYFKDMFSNTFKERTTDSIILREVSTATFQQVLRFVYTGDAKIDHDNFWDVFRASEFFCISGLRDSCISFAKRNMDKFTVQNLLNMYLYAHANKKYMLTSVLRPQLAHQLEMFYKADEFLKLSFEALSEIIKHRSGSSTRVNVNEAVLAATKRWLRHEGRERFPYAQALVKFVSFKDITPGLEQPRTTDLSLSDDATPPRSKLTQDHLPVVVECDSLSKDLHFYFAFAQEDMTRIFSIDSSTGVCAFTGTILDADLKFTTVAINNALVYRLLYSGQYDPPPDEDEPTFSAYKSADMQTKLSLKPPPIHFQNVSLCAIRNHIYAYHESLPCAPVRTASTSNSRSLFHNEAIERGIFAYNCEVDEWLPVPEMRVKSQFASMAALDDTLFLVGGYLFDGAFQKYMQAYDMREGVWRRLPGTEKNYFEASACCLERKIHVFGGAGNINCERYDPVAGKWERLADMEHPLSMHSKSITYQHKIWVMNRDPIPEDADNDALSVAQKWFFQTGKNRLNADSRSRSLTWGREFINLKKENATRCVDGIAFRKI